jgi:flagellar hook-basal body complex protein FliE
LSISRIDLMKLGCNDFTAKKKIREQCKESFCDYLKKGMTKVNELQLQSEQEVRKLVTGDVEDISQVVVAVEEAEIALRLFVEIRDKLVDAYQQLARIPV